MMTCYIVHLHDDQAMSIDDMYIYCRLCDIVVVAKFLEVTRSEQLLEK